LIGTLSELSLGDPLKLRDDDNYTYHQLRAKIYGFNDEGVAKEMFIANHFFQVGPIGKPWRI